MILKEKSITKLIEKIASHSVKILTPGNLIKVSDQSYTKRPDFLWFDNKKDENLEIFENEEVFFVIDIEGCDVICIRNTGERHAICIDSIYYQYDRFRNGNDYDDFIKHDEKYFYAQTIFEKIERK